VYYFTNTLENTQNVDNMITIKDLGFSYDKSVVIRNINLTLEEGKIYGLLGENGVGKTTLLTLLSGLKAPKAGEILIDSEIPYKRTPSFLSNIYYLSDEVGAPAMKGIDYAKAYGAFWQSFSLEKFIEVAKVLDVDPNQQMDKMSYGQLKKTHISFALACNTKYLFMDEPTNGLDIPSKAQFRKAVTKYTSEDSTLLISTHQVRDLENIIDPIIILEKQEILLKASIEEITNKLCFDYGNELKENVLYSEMTPGGHIQVYLNQTGEDSKVNIEVLFNTVLQNKELIKSIF
jgi:ABC-2 type transport system ATP-binding protein